MCCTLAIGSVILVAITAGLSSFVSFNLLTLVGGTTVVPLAFFYILKTVLYLRKIPPGPYSYPVLGSLVDFYFENPIVKCQEYIKKYGKTFSLTVGEFSVIVISDYKMIQEVFKRDEFQGRPDFESWTERNGGYKNRGILMSDGDKNQQDQRRFALRTLQDFGFGKQSLDDLLLHEVRDLIRVFQKTAGRPTDIKTELNSAVFNSLWFIMTGQRFEQGDRRFKELMEMFAGHTDSLSIFSLTNFFPWLAKLNFLQFGKYQKSQEMKTRLLDLMDEIINEHLETFHEGIARDFVDVYLQTHFNAHPKSSSDASFAGEEGLRNLRITLLDLFHAGTETTSTLLHWAILYLTKYPNVQQKLHEEIDMVMESNRLPTRENRQNMPYLEAFINEVQRKASILPMGVPHAAQENSNFGGFLFKKGAIILPFFYAAHHDPTFWGLDAFKFKPERFLNPSGTQVVRKEALMPFSTGKRQCLGESLAKDSLFYFLAGLLQSFYFKLDDSADSGGNEIEMNIPKPNFIRSPYDYKVIMRSRDTI